MKREVRYAAEWLAGICIVRANRRHRTKCAGGVRSQCFSRHKQRLHRPNHEGKVKGRCGTGELTESQVGRRRASMPAREVVGGGSSVMVGCGGGKVIRPE